MNILRHSKSPKLIPALWVIAALLGALHAFISRSTMNADGVSYVDIAESYFRLPVSLAVSGYFSPLYSWLLGIFLCALHPNARWESPLIHLINCLLFLCALWSFKDLANELLRLKRTADIPADAPYSDQECAWIIFFYTLFIWAALGMITIATVAPDMLYTAIIFLVFSRVVRIRRAQASFLDAAVLGLLLGVAYLTRVAALPVVSIILLSLFQLCGDLRRSVPRVLIAGIGFLLIAGPYIGLLSVAKGHATFGGTGTMIYAWHVDQKPWQNWQGPGATHPTRLLYSSPRVYEFATPITGTYPPWYDPSYWDDGMLPTYRIRPLIANFVRNSKHLIDYFLELGGILVGLLSLHLASRSNIRVFLKGLQPLWPVILPSAVALLIYVSLHVEPRYITSFWLTLWMAMFFALPVSFRDLAPTYVIPILAAMVIFLIVGIVDSTFVQIRNIAAYSTNNNQIAAGLAALTDRLGEEVATIGISNNIYWARLARLRVVAEVPAEDATKFWLAPQAVKSDIYNRLAEKGVGLVVANGVPSAFASSPWRPLGSGFSACRLADLRTEH